MSEQYKDKYVVDIEYTNQYYSDLSPLFINFCLLSNLIEPPSIEGKFTYCELGFGKGTTLLSMAENFPDGEFYGIDFNPAHVKYGEYMAKKGNLTNIHFYNMPFSQALKEKKQFPKFDYIIFHGVYSWVSSQVRKDMIKFCDKMIKNGGVVYNSYNALPGSLYRSQLQKLLLEASHTSTSRSDIRMDHSIKIVDEFLEQPLMAGHKNLKKSLDLAKKQDRNYLPHEYLNIGWKSCYFIDIEKKFSKKGFDFVGTCSPTNAFSSFTLPAEINTFLTKYFTAGTPIFEHFKDHFLGTSFRKDLYIKGIKKHSLYEIKKILSKYKFLFISPNQQINESIDYESVNIKISDDVIKHFTKKLSKGSFFDELIYNNDTRTTLFYISLFVSSSLVAIIANDETNKKHNLNKAFCNEYMSSNKSEYLSAFNIKSAFIADFFDRLFYKFYDEKNMSKMVDKIDDHLKKETNMEIQNNSVGSTKEYLEQRFELWNKEVLPIWKKIGII